MYTVYIDLITKTKGKANTMATRIESKLKRLGFLTDDILELVNFEFSTNEVEFSFIEGDYSADWQLEEKREKAYEELEPKLFKAIGWSGYQAGK